MNKKLIPMAICYDFDGTLSPTNMQEYGFISKLGITPQKFWEESENMAKEHKADNILAYMKLMKNKAQEKKMSFRKKDITDYGKKVELFKGVEDWFKRINQYGAQRGIKVKHYIISSGLKEMIEGTKIAREFTEIFASCFMYDANGAADWPAVALNYTTKTQFLFRINKECTDINDNKSINKYVEPLSRPMPFTNIIYIGDGDTDIPCMKIVKKEGGHSIAVYNPGKKKAKEKAANLIKDGRVNIIAPADYSEGKQIDTYLKAIIDKLVADEKVK